MEIETCVFLLLFANVFYNILTSAESSVEQRSHCSLHPSVKVIDKKFEHCENQAEDPITVWISNNFEQLVNASVCGELTLTCSSTQRVTWNYDGLEVPPVSAANAAINSGCYSVSITIKIDSNEPERWPTGGFVCTVLEKSAQNNSTVVYRIYRTEKETLSRSEVEPSKDSNVQSEVSKDLVIKKWNTSDCVMLTCKNNFSTNASDGLEIAFAPCENLLHCKFQWKYIELGLDFPEEFTKPYKCSGSNLKPSTISLSPNETSGLIMCRFKADKSYIIKHHYQDIPATLPDSILPANNSQPPPGLVADIHNRTYFVHDNVQATCYASSFLYAPFPTWRVGFSNGTSITARGAGKTDNEGGTMRRVQELEINSSNISTLTCEVPQWESNGVVRVTYELKVYVGSAPRITNGSPPVITINGTEMPRIFVEYTVIPQATDRRWTRDNATGLSESESARNGTYISEVSLDKGSPRTWPGVYKYEIRNGYDSDTRTIRVVTATEGNTATIPVETPTEGVLYILLPVAVAMVLLVITVICILRTYPLNAASKALKRVAPCFFNTPLDLGIYRPMFPGLELAPTGDYVILSGTNGGIQNIFGAEEVTTVEVIRKIGEGNYGDVYFAVIDQKRAALKRIKEQQGEVRRSKDMLQKELKTLTTVGEHDNVIKFMGAVSVRIWPNEIIIVTEFCELGDLKTYVEKRKDLFKNQIIDDRVYSRNSTHETGRNSSYLPVSTDVALTTIELIQWAKQLAAGLKHISSRNLIHGDIAMRNLLLDEKKILKIGDFGLSRRIQEDCDYYKISNTQDSQLPWLHLAPEVFRTAKISIETDVYACGVTLWEMFTLGGRPYETEYGLPTFEFQCRLQNGSLILGQPRYATSQIYNAMKSCWKLNPDDRISFGELETELQRIITIAEEATLPATATPPYSRFMPFDGANNEHVERVPGYVQVSPSLPNDDDVENGDTETSGLMP